MTQKYALMGSFLCKNILGVTLGNFCSNSGAFSAKELVTLLCLFVSPTQSLILGQLSSSHRKQFLGLWVVANPQKSRVWVQILILQFFNAK